MKHSLFLLSIIIVLIFGVEVKGQEYTPVANTVAHLTITQGCITTQLLDTNNAIITSALLQVFTLQDSLMGTMQYHPPGDPYDGYYRFIVPDITTNYIVKCISHSPVYSKTVGGSDSTIIHSNNFTVLSSDFVPDWNFNGVTEHAYPRQFFIEKDSQLTLIENGLVAYYPFNGNANDESGNGNNGTVNGATLTTDRFANPNKAYLFNGSTSHIVVPYSSSIGVQNGITMSVWVFMDGGTILSYPPRVMEIRNGSTSNYSMLSWGNSNITRTFLVYFGGIIGINPTDNVSALTWHHLVFTADRATGEGYFLVDGIVTNSVNGSTDTPVGYDGSSLFIGAEPNLSGKWGGIIDDIRIYNRALSQSEIDSLYHEGGWDPQVKSVSPTQNALSTPKSTNISATFNVAMDTSTLDTNNILVYGSQSGKHTSAISLSGDTMFTFNPTTDFMAGEIVNVTLTKNILSAGGDSLTNGYHWGFGVETSPQSPDTFSLVAEYATGSNPRSVFIGDIDGDGDGDMAVANENSASVSVLKNNANGIFTHDSDYATGVNPNSIFLSNIDGDDYADIAVTNSTTHIVSIFLNNGNGTFASKVDYPTGNNPTSVFVSDVDGDGDGDLAIANYSSATVSILRNNGDGTFATRVDYATGINPTSVFVSDVDRDGDGDIAVANATSNSVSILRNYGDGTYAPQAQYSTGDDPYSVYINDLDNDGDGDVIVGNRVSNNVSILKNNGDGTLASKIDYATGNQVLSVFVSDVDGDADVDLIVGNHHSKTVSVMKNDASGSFGAKVDYTTVGMPYCLFVADVNADGDVDIVVGNDGLSSVSIFINTVIPKVTSVSPTQNALSTPKSTNISATFNVAMNTSTLNASNILVYGSQSGKHTGAITLSGDTMFTFNPTTDFMAGEIVNVTLTKNILSAGGDSLTNGYHWGFTVANSPSCGLFRTKNDFSLGNATPNNIFMNDVEGDGDGDIAVVTENPNGVKIYKNNGTGAFDSAGSYLLGEIIENVFLYDIDSDGECDLVAANISSNTISVLRNDGNGYFGLRADYPTVSQPSGIFIRDIDGDGDEDIAVVNYATNFISILKNNGDGSFALKEDYQTAYSPYAISINDLDNDGDGDLVVTSYSHDSISVYKNNGNGTFLLEGAYNSTGQGTASLFICDLNGDGDADIAYVDESSNVSILSNNGDGTFYADSIYNTGYYPTSIFISDIDGDTDADIAVANYGDSSGISILRNNGDGIFSPKEDYSTGATNTKALLINDIDGDGDGDLVVFSKITSAFWIMKNECLASISGTKFHDLNGNGFKDGNDTGLVNWKIILSGAASETTFTDVTGYYIFDSLSAGTYTVTEELQSGWVQTFPDTGYYTITITAGDSITGKDFGNSGAYASISGKKYLDTNADSSISGDAGLSGWVIKLYQDCNLVARTVTDANGYYRFDSLTAGTYTVEESLKVGWVQTYPRVISPNVVTTKCHPNNGTRSYSFMISSGDTITNADFGNGQRGSICGVKFEDINGNGVREIGDPGLPGWTILLQGPVTQFTQTDANGHYCFSYIPPGYYIVSEAPQDGWIKIVGGCNLLLPSGGNDTCDFGNFKLGSISGMKYNDMNGDASQDTDEVPISGWRIYLNKSGAAAPFATEVTDVNGNFVFDSLLYGKHYLYEEQRPGWSQTTSPFDTITIVSRTDTAGLYIGNLHGYRRDCEVLAKWNMLSLPLVVPENRKIIVFPSSVSPAFTFEGSYVLEDSLKNGIGYWLKFDSSESVAIIGDKLDDDTIAVNAGWNMLGSLSDTISTSCITPLGTSIESPFFGYHNGYVQSDVIVPCKAYWIKVSADGKLVLKGGCVAAKRSRQ